MRKEIYRALKERLLSIREDGETSCPVIKHIALWNKQVEFMEQESVFPLPAVFVEFDKITWRTQSGGLQDADLNIALHVLTNAVPEGYDGDEFHLDLLDKINNCLSGFTSDYMGSMVRVASVPCHDHEEILDDTEVFKCFVTDDSACRKTVKIAPRPEISIKKG